MGIVCGLCQNAHLLVSLLEFRLQYDRMTTQSGIPVGSTDWQGNFSTAIGEPNTKNGKIDIDTMCYKLENSAFAKTTEPNF